MAKTKAGGKTRQKTNREGRRLGIKVFGGQKVKPGMILLRQMGTQYHPGGGVKMGRDFTIFSIKDGAVVFRRKKEDIIVSVV